MATPLPDLLPMRPFFREVVWGGRRLEEIYGKQLPPGRPIGESFELSAYPERESTVRSGPLEGRSLSSLVQAYGAELVGRGAWERYGAEFALLVKLIDAREDLSIQVHPDDAYARACDLGPFGKMEAWYVLESHGGRIALGLQEGVGPKELTAALGAGKVEEAVRMRDVRAGDLVFLPPGTVHALCSGLVVYEVQQSSDLTFRLHDYGRAGTDGEARELHVERAMEIIDFDSRPQVRPHSADGGDGAAKRRLIEAEHFHLTLHRTQGEAVLHQSGDSFLALTHIKGEAAEVEATGGRCGMRLGDTLLVPAGREVWVRPPGGAEGSSTLEYLAASAAL